MMLQAAMEYLAKSLGGFPVVKEIHKDHRRRVVAVTCSPHDEGAIHTYDIEPELIQHRFSSLEGLLEYINSAHCAHADDSPAADGLLPGVVFVNEKSVQARLNYGRTPMNVVRLELA